MREVGGEGIDDREQVRVCPGVVSILVFDIWP
jgi:hypothetical protein